MINRSAQILIFYRNKLLLLHRENIPTINYPNTWGLIGGIIEKNETPFQCIKRETKEETNLSPKAIEYLGKTYLKETNCEYFIFVTVLEITELNTLKLGEGQELNFFNFSELKNMTLGGNICRFFRKYPNALNKLMKGILIDPNHLGLENN